VSANQIESSEHIVEAEEVLIDNPETRSRNLGSFTFGDWLYLSVCVSVGIMLNSILSYGKLALIATIIFWMMTGLVRTDWGRPYSVAWDELVSLKIRLWEP
jgi:hypothetical protein